MKSMMKRTTVREIRQSFGRFFAILAIIALGVGFYAGLSVARDAMLQTGNHYLENLNFYDFRLLSTYGFEEPEVEYFKTLEDVENVEGAYQVDALYIDGAGNEAVIKLHSLMEDINQTMLRAGRMPENSGECVVDSELFTEEDIGTKLVIAENNEEDTLDMLTNREYTIVGLVQSSYYMNFERGTTSIGNGKITGFAYLLPDGFDSEYFTEVFVTFLGWKEIYSTEYEDFIDEKTKIWEIALEDKIDERYQTILSDAQTELQDATDELEEKEAEARQELDNAYAELVDAKEEIEDGEKQLADAKKEIQDSRKPLTDAMEQIEQMEQMTAGMMQMPDATTMAQAEAMQTQKAQLEEALAQLDAYEKELRDKEQELEDARVKLAEGTQEYEEGEAEFETEIADAKQKIADAEEEIADIEAPSTYVLDRNTNIGYVCLESDSGIVEGVAKVFPVFFFLVAALVCITTMNRMVEEQRTQIGVLKALGYREPAIMSKYMFYSGSGALIGCLFGFFFGTWGFPKVIWTGYGIMYTLVPIEYVFKIELLVLSLVVSLLCSVGTTWLSCRHELSEVAAELMRPKAPRAGKRVLLERIPFIWKRLKFLHKVSVRNIFRYKRRIFMMILGISGCTALLVTGLGLKDSIANIAESQYDEIMTFDATISFEKGQDVEADTGFTKAAEELSDKYIYISEKTMDMLSNDGKNQMLSSTMNLITIKDAKQMEGIMDFHTTKKVPLEYQGKGEAFISHKIADLHNIEVGDEILLRNDEMKEMRVRIAGIFENYIYNYVFITEETYEAQFGEAAEYKSAYMIFNDKKEVHESAALLMQLDEVTAVNINQDMAERIGSMMSSLDFIIITVIICAGLLAFIVLYNLTNINITERIREIATIKVLGFYKNETALYVFRENMVLTGVGALVGLVLGKLLHIFVMSQINIDMIAFNIQVTPLSYIISIVLTFAFAWLVNIVMSVKIDKINMAESLKSVD